MKNDILKHFKIDNKTNALNAGLQYRNHPNTEILYNKDENISEPILKHIRTCATCSKLHNDLSGKQIKTSEPNTVTKLEIGDILVIPAKDIFDTDRINDKNEYFNPPEVCVLDIQENIVTVAQCFPDELKPIANKGDILTNEGYYVEAWNQYTIPYNKLCIENYEYDEYIKKAVSKKLIKNIVSYKNTYHTKNIYTDKFRENELRIAKIWISILESK